MTTPDPVREARIKMPNNPRRYRDNPRAWLGTSLILVHRPLWLRILHSIKDFFRG